MSYAKVYEKFNKAGALISIGIAFKLSLNEFSCKCDYADCTHTLVNTKLVKAWDLTRARWGKPLKVNSGFRCIRHNTEVGGKIGSKHTTGRAVDISIKHYDEVEKSKLIDLANEHFDFVKIYPTFIHAQIND